MIRRKLHVIKVLLVIAVTSCIWLILSRDFLSPRMPDGDLGLEDSHNVKVGVVIQQREPPSSSQKQSPTPEQNYHKDSKQIPPQPDVDVLFDVGNSDDVDDEMRLAGLVEQMGFDWHWAWIKSRIESRWSEFTGAAHTLMEKYPQIATRKKRKILILPGVLTVQNFAKPEVIKAGGPLGELVQWSDLIGGLQALGHHVSLQYDLHKIGRILLAASNQSAPHSTGCDIPGFDLIFTDIGGYHGLPAPLIPLIKHRLRVLDVFGTEAAFNDPLYARSHGTAIDHWGQLGLHLKQFCTLYPHTPDNFFLGFAVSDKLQCRNSTKENIGIIMGKELKYLKGRRNVLEAVSQYVVLHSTLPLSALLPSSAINHGVMSAQSFSAVAKKAKVFVGLGDPIESPGVFDCLACGCVFINPLKHGRERDQLHGKPTSRRITSQNTYLERYVGEPHVYTVDYNRLDEVHQVMDKVMNTQVNAMLPYEFSVEGYLQRLSYHLEHVDLCRSERITWPPVSSLRAVLGETGMSCTDVCYQRGLVCEPAFFPHINSKEYIFRLNVTCSKFGDAADIFAPVFESVTSQCVLQDRSKLFSCAGDEARMRRICPCRGYKKQQLELCNVCV